MQKRNTEKMATIIFVPDDNENLKKPLLDIEDRLSSLITIMAIDMKIEFDNVHILHASGKDDGIIAHILKDLFGKDAIHNVEKCSLLDFETSEGAAVKNWEDLMKKIIRKIWYRTNFIFIIAKPDVCLSLSKLFITEQFLKVAKHNKKLLKEVLSGIQRPIGYLDALWLKIKEKPSYIHFRSVSW